MTEMTERLLAYLREQQIEFTVLHHEPARTSEEAAHVRGTPLHQGAKALLFRLDGRHALLVTPADRRIVTRTFKQSFGVKNMGIVSAEELWTLTGLEVGAVPPFGNLLGLPTYVDERLLQLPRISFNAGSRTASVIMSPSDYARLVDPVVGRFASEDEPPAE